MGRCWGLHPTSRASYPTKQPVGSKGPQLALGRPTSFRVRASKLGSVNHEQPWEVAMETPILQVRKPGWERGSLGQEVTESGLDIFCDPDCLHLPRPRAWTVVGGVGGAGPSRSSSPPWPLGWTGPWSHPCGGRAVSLLSSRACYLPPNPHLPWLHLKGEGPPLTGNRSMARWKKPGSSCSGNLFSNRIVATSLRL